MARKIVDNHRSRMPRPPITDVTPASIRADPPSRPPIRPSAATSPRSVHTPARAAGRVHELTWTRSLPCTACWSAGRGKAAPRSRVPRAEYMGRWGTSSSRGVSG